MSFSGLQRLSSVFSFIYPLAMFLAGIIGFSGMKGMSYSLDDSLHIISAVLITSVTVVGICNIGG